MAYYARLEYTGDGTNKNFSVAFPYLSPDHIKVLLNGVESSAWTWFGGSLIVMGTAPAVGDTLVIYRDSSRTARLVDYTSPGVTDTVLNTDSLQAFYLAQEAVDTANSALVSEATLQLDAGDRRITHVADPVEDQDAATKNWVLNTSAAAISAAAAASASEAAAAVSESAAAASETAAGAAQTAAEQAAAEAQSNAAAASELISFKNKLINPGFEVNQRNETSWVIASGGLAGNMMADRWRAIVWDADCTFEVKAPALDHQEFLNYMAVTPTRNGIVIALSQRVEDVRTLAGETVTMSAWIRSSSNFDLNCYSSHNYGSGSSEETVVVTDTNVPYTGNGGWVWVEHTFTLPNVGGKDIRDDSYISVQWRLVNGSIQPFDITNCQLERGSNRTAFEKRPLAVEHSLCHRYYWAGEAMASVYDAGSNGAPGFGNAFIDNVWHPVPMRTTPTVDEFQISASAGGTPDINPYNENWSVVRLASSGPGNGPERSFTVYFALDAEL